MGYVVDITKTKKLMEVNNERCHNWYYLVNGRIYNEEKTQYRKFRYVLFFDVFDVLESLDSDKFTEKEFCEFLDEQKYSLTEIITSFENCKEFFEECNKTIQHYNELDKY